MLRLFYRVIYLVQIIISNWFPNTLFLIILANIMQPMHVLFAIFK